MVMMMMMMMVMMMMMMMILRFPLGVGQTAGLAFFLFWNPEARLFARKRLKALTEDFTCVTLARKGKVAPLEAPGAMEMT